MQDPDQLLDRPSNPGLETPTSDLVQVAVCRQLMTDEACGVENGIDEVRSGVGGAAQGRGLMRRVEQLARRTLMLPQRSR